MINSPRFFLIQRNTGQRLEDVRVKVDRRVVFHEEARVHRVDVHDGRDLLELHEAELPHGSGVRADPRGHHPNRDIRPYGQPQQVVKLVPPHDFTADRQHQRLVVHIEEELVARLQDSLSSDSASTRLSMSLD